MTRRRERALDTGHEHTHDTGREHALDAGRERARDAGREQALDAGREHALDAAREHGLDAPVARERRWLALALPLFPVEVARRETPALRGRPLALVERKGGSLYVRAASLEALAAGVRPGTTHAHALAAAPDLVVRERREEDERDALLSLARWAAFALAPRPSVEPLRHALLVDVTGTELVHASESALLGDALARLRGLGHEARGAIAATPLAALALADVGALEAGRAWLVAAPGETRRALLPLPPRALGLAPPVVATLEELGIRTVGELLRLPRASLPARFGDELPATLERALGERAHGLAPARFPELVVERLLLEGGTDRLEDVTAALEELARRATERLAAEGRAPRVLELVVEREMRRPETVPLALAAAVGSLPALTKLLRERLERVDLGDPVTALELRVHEAARRRERQGLLFSARDADTAGLPADAELACLLARLENRLGPRRVLRAELVADHRPERAFAYVPVVDDPRAKPPRAKKPRAEPARGPRPARLLARPLPVGVFAPAGEPERLVLRGRDLAVRRAWGPERLETGFWDGHEVRRDYWVVLDETGRATWVFRDLDTDRWFVHGFYD